MEDQKAAGALNPAAPLSSLHYPDSELVFALVYAVGYSAELGLSLVTYYTGPSAGRAAE